MRTPYTHIQIQNTNTIKQKLMTRNVLQGRPNHEEPRTLKNESNRHKTALMMNVMELSRSHQCNDHFPTIDVKACAETALFISQPVNQWTFARHAFVNPTTACQASSETTLLVQSFWKPTLCNYSPLIRITWCKISWKFNYLELFEMPTLQCGIQFSNGLVVENTSRLNKPNRAQELVTKQRSFPCSRHLPHCKGRP